ncbi:NADH-dependent flavin oxidoreductase [Acinetobacter baumannii]|uniref:NADH-dependent flavin oxidoreductase n=1 Tax=Acinetobacter baumannii TaxID=470 RepID=UPI001C0D448B|nr:NADH-dependent flavin oxidoreductase [Acinetobacter baumannii]EHU1702785.1 NADH-dependent flavin oxidoreductase [Acinetobacter baumannii]MBU3167767.1 NADH-dependent flavin oxidoreductase [Acinetobacter baumannii]MDC5311172.1 NADH-dependent flavin oxidoreductase [Acinetobacter baumannii]MDN8272036.1 NADH-dependent flavin oxidoreductase [Acinetobacter baumannii]CAI3133968.1 NADH oxidase [Acinetobacter baumannii]
MTMEYSKLFQSFALTPDIELRNRIIMAPMTTWSANQDGSVSEQELNYIRQRVNGVGLVITGCTHVQENGIGFTNEFAAFDDRFIVSLKELAQAAKSGGAPAILQIFHAGNKAIPDLIPNADVVSASALKTPTGSFIDSQMTTRALSHEEILEVIHAFGETTRRAIEAGFDGIELHGAHGFLIQNFFSPLFNQREDEWGGSLEKRMHFPLEIVKEVKRVIKQYSKRPFALGYRISVEEYEENGLRIGDSLQLIDRLIESGIDYLHVSLTDILNGKPIDSVDEKLTIQTVIAHVNQRVPLISAGKIRTPYQAEEALALGLPLVAIGKALVMNPDWVELAANHQNDKISTELENEKNPELHIPDHLWHEIKIRKGWFPIRQLEQV